MSHLKRSVLIAALASLAFCLPASADGATVSLSLASAPVEGSVLFTATGELKPPGAIETFVTTGASCPATMQEATSAFLGRPEDIEGGSFSSGFSAWIVQSGPILACAYDESFADATEGHASLGVTITPAPDTTCNPQTRICTRVTTTTTPTSITREVCEGAEGYGGCTKETEAIGTSAQHAVKIKVSRATQMQLRALTRAATAHHSGGFDAKRDRLSHGKITSNGWASASWSIFPHGAQPEVIVFHAVHGHWHPVTWGSAVCEPGQHRIPSFVCRALGL